jgi:hypothetical protein
MTQGSRWVSLLLVDAAQCARRSSITRIAGHVQRELKHSLSPLVFRTSIDDIARPPGPLGQLITSERSSEVAPKILRPVCMAVHVNGGSR